MNFKISRYTLIFLTIALIFIVSGCQKKDSPGSTGSSELRLFKSQPTSMGAALEIVSPKESEVSAESIEVYFAVAGIDISENGPHLHFILDDGDVLEHYEPGSPARFEDLTPGAHVIRALAVNKDHVSFKSIRAFDLVQFFSKESIGEPQIDGTQPMLFLNVPSGSYDSSDDIIFDIWLSNARLGIYDYKIEYSLDGHEGSLQLWKTWQFDDLSEGKHKLTLNLIDPNGKAVLGNFNHTVRTFVIE